MNGVLADILVVLVAAKAAVEVAERLRVPAVVGEIAAGILIGPSALGWVHHTTATSSPGVLATLGEIGVILLLLEVGMQMDLRELASVGRAALAVAVTGVVLPFALGYVIAGGPLGLDANASLFVGAALTATSVGITARVFGDLRALASIEARTVLGAAIADDVIGLVILTVVVRIVTGTGSVSVGSVASVVALALAFLVVTIGLGSLLVPRAFGAIERLSRSSGTLLALAFAFTLAVSELAGRAKLAPIVGAFVAGLALGRSPAASRLQRELAPIGHLFVPVFFLEIGINTDVRQFARATVLRDAAVLVLVAVVGKVLAGAAIGRAPGNRLLIGIGMIPRGEVGLIFASIGLREAILGDDLYAALLLMVLVTTLITPPLLALQQRRVGRARPGAADAADGSDESDATEPVGGWLREHANVLDLAAVPPSSMMLPVGLEAALAVAQLDPTARLLDWLSASAARGTAVVWDVRAVDAFKALIRRGSARSWRLLETTGVLARAVPELSDALARRRGDVRSLDPAGFYRWALLERILRLERGETDQAGDRRAVVELGKLDDAAPLHLACLLLDAFGDGARPEVAVAPLVERLALADPALAEAGALVADRELYRAAASRPEGLDEQSVVRLAVHLATAARARALYVLTLVANGLEEWERARLGQLHQLVLATLPAADGTAAGRARGFAALASKRDAAASLVAPGAHRSAAVDRIDHAPLDYLIAATPDAIAAQVVLLEPLPGRNDVRVRITPEVPSMGRLPGATSTSRSHSATAPVPVAATGVASGRRRLSIEIATRDRIGLLAASTGVLERIGTDVVAALLATWGDGGALQVFTVTVDPAAPLPTGEFVAAEVRKWLRTRPTPTAVLDADLAFDDSASPWHTVVEVRATDRRGLLHAIAVAFSQAEVDVHTAAVSTEHEMAYDVFHVTDRNGRKLDASTRDAVRAVLVGGRGDSRPAHRIAIFSKH